MGAGASAGCGIAIDESNAEELQALFETVPKANRDKLELALSSLEGPPKETWSTVAIVTHMSGDVAAEIRPVPASVLDLKKEIQAVEGTGHTLQQLLHETGGLLDDERVLEDLIDDTGSLDVLLLVDEAAGIIKEVEDYLLVLEVVIKKMQSEREKTEGEVNITEDLKMQFLDAMRGILKVKKLTQGMEEITSKMEKYFRASNWDDRMQSLGDVLSDLEKSGALTSLNGMLEEMEREEDDSEKQAAGPPGGPPLARYNSGAFSGASSAVE